MIRIDQSILIQADEVLDRLGQTAARLLLLLNGYESGSRGECRAKVSTLAIKLERTERTVRRAMAELKASGLWVKTDRRIRWAGRNLTDLGRICARILLGERFEIRARVSSPPPMSGHMSAHKGEADPSMRELPRGDLSEDRSADPRPSIDPRDYQLPRKGATLRPQTWTTLAEWMRTARSVSFARCKIAARSFYGISIALGRSKEWRRYERSIRPKDSFPVHPEEIVRLAIEEARRSRASFGSVESSARYIAAILESCIREGRIPGEKSRKYQ